MKPIIARFFAIAAVTVILSACGGGGGSRPLTQGQIDEVRSDPRVVRAAGIVERANTLTIPSIHIRWDLSAAGQRVTDRLAVGSSCTGTRCVLENGEVFELTDLLDPSADIDLTQIDLSSRGGFDTVTIAGKFDTSSNIEGVTVTRGPSASAYGFWGEHGFAAVEITDGPLTGRINGILFSGDISSATAYILGDAAGTNPTGLGSATWSGIADAASTRTFQRRQGTAIVTIADLSQPRVSVDIDIAGYAIGSPAWENMQLTRGRYGAGTASSDYLSGHFVGSDHGETFGVFDTGAYVGAFGAKRAP